MKWSEWLAIGSIIGLIMLLRRKARDEIKAKVLRHRKAIKLASDASGVRPEIIAAIMHLACNGDLYCIISFDGQLSCGPIPILSSNWERCQGNQGYNGLINGARILKIYLDHFGLRKGLKRYAQDNLGVGLRWQTYDEFVQQCLDLAFEYVREL